MATSSPIPLPVKALRRQTAGDAQPPPACFQLASCLFPLITPSFCTAQGGNYWFLFALRTVMVYFICLSSPPPWFRTASVLLCPARDSDQLHTQPGSILYHSDPPLFSSPFFVLISNIQLALAGQPQITEPTFTLSYHNANSSFPSEARTPHFVYKASMNLYWLVSRWF